HPSPKGISNWVMTEGLAWLNKQPEDTTIDAFPVTAQSIAELVKLIDTGAITGKIAKQVFPIMLETGKRPGVIVEEKGLKPVDDSALDPIIDEVLADPRNEKTIADLRGGKAAAIGALMGAVMKKSGGKANPQTVTPLIRKKLGLE
ncbi:MAG TPA: Asp-tRNA(Asn)/Glu-tRNA(Gln) amidotransferase GatCAB subunit B, partial [Candidatus Sumerlaeota bacterium]|nr:Asp-tRNA(Asn)/Glu-tRNA(Gln) amidotransferase GatCAB subunit B [Candidatus Sumerlaeota bacterium]